jgi:hypothetical protein
MGVIGYKHTEEAKKRIREASIGRKHPPRSDEWKAKQRVARLGKKSPQKKKGAMPEWHKQKISASLKGLVRTPEHRQKLADARRGEKSHFWKGGISTANEIARKSVEYAMWHEECIRRDDYTCQDCGNRSGNGHRVELHVDHIKPFSIFPELRYVVSNGRTLCKPCHEATDTYGGKMLRYREKLLVNV